MTHILWFCSNRPPAEEQYQYPRSSYGLRSTTGVSTSYVLIFYFNHSRSVLIFGLQVIVASAHCVCPGGSFSAPSVSLSAPSFLANPDYSAGRLRPHRRPRVTGRHPRTVDVIRFLRLRGMLIPSADPPLLTQIHFQYR
jgi:hypothetical protein